MFPSLHILANGLPMLSARIMLSGWFCSVLLLFVFIASLIYHRVRLKKVRLEKAGLSSDLAEKSVLLEYATQNEQRSKEASAIATKSKKELLSKISHEIRTPLNAMWGMTSLLNETGLTPEQRQYTNALIRSGEEMLKIVNDILLNDILQYSDMEHGTKSDQRHFDLSATIEEVLNVFAERAAQSDIELLYKMGDNVPGQIVGDNMRIRQILMNLVENAFRFTKQGEISIGVHVAEYSITGLKLEFEVRDSGIGMSFEQLKKISLSLIDSEHPHEAVSAVGMNLSMCKKLVSLMGGFIEVESEPDNGTIFRFVVTVGKTTSVIQTPNSLLIHDFGGQKILVADDNEKAARTLSQLCRSLNLQVIEAHSTSSAIQALSQQNDIKAVLIDETLTDEMAKDGTNIQQRFSAVPFALLHKLPIAHGQSGKGAFEFSIRKPFVQNELLKTMNKLLRDATAETKSAERALPQDFARKHPLNILIAEDDAMNQQMIQMVLKKLGYESQIAVNGKDVLEMVSHKNYNLILMDVQMPEMDGLEATRMIRLCLDNQPVIVAMTANTLQGDREECLAAGMDDYISKPVNLPVLTGVLQKWAMRQQQRKASEVLRA